MARNTSSIAEARKASNLSKKKVHGIARNFFLGDNLYTRIKVQKHLDQIECWGHVEKAFVLLSFSYVLHNQETAYGTTEVAKMLWRAPGSLLNSIQRGNIRPTIAYIPVGRPDADPIMYAWNKKGIMEAWEYFVNTNYRGSGSPVPTPSKKELRAALNHEVVMYIRDDSGEFIPTWR